LTALDKVRAIKRAQDRKMLPCSVCDAPGPSDAHHVKQHRQYVCVALCKDCHQGSILGWHGQKRAWAVRKMDEIDALNVTIERLIDQILEEK